MLRDLELARIDLYKKEVGNKDIHDELSEKTGHFDPDNGTLDEVESDDESDLDFDIAEMLMSQIKTQRSGKKKGKKGNLEIYKVTPKGDRNEGRRRTRRNK